MASDFAIVSFGEPVICILARPGRITWVRCFRCSSGIRHSDSSAITSSCGDSKIRILASECRVQLRLLRAKEGPSPMSKRW
jgi:hypothetical protein